MFYKIGQKIITSRTTPARMAQKFSLFSKLLISQYVKKQFNSVDPKIKTAFSNYLDKIFQLPESYQGVIYDVLEPPSLSAKFPLRELIIEKINIPIVFYYGEFDYMDTTAAQYICTLKSNCKFARIAKSTHHPNMQNPEELCNHMINFIKAVSYTHLTLPTKRIVQISVVAVSLKKKKIKNNRNCDYSMQTDKTTIKK
eukprot:TRINITY_DN41547_c0_g1_i1.p2 TRINITY_DN41547_c0_g1~~TRINITY_DN41547_c0_g1_i1.p2  ORF type:complete len:198 (+),score=21.07 TRINITY_DN41547_c0_g1_i1:555-1148(+)